MSKEKRNNIIAIFSATLLIIAALFIVSYLRNYEFNETVHQKILSGDLLFRDQDDESQDVSVRIVARSSTWTKIFDLEGEGIEEPDYQAFTYDFYVSNNTDDELSDYTYKLTFDRDVYLMSAWNGSLTIFQEGYSDTIPDLREFDPSAFSFDTVEVDGEVLIHMKPGEYLIYLPSSGDAMEIPVSSGESSIPGMIIYVPIGDAIGQDLEKEDRDL